MCQWQGTCLCILQTLCCSVRSQSARPSLMPLDPKEFATLRFNLEGVTCHTSALVPHVSPHKIIAGPTVPVLLTSRSTMASALSASLLQTRLSFASRSVTTALPTPFKSHSIPSRPALSTGWSRKRSTAPSRLIAMVSGKLRRCCTCKNAYEVALIVCVNGLCTHGQIASFDGFAAVSFQM